MDDNVHTYRIPALATTTKGTLLAVYDMKSEIRLRFSLEAIHGCLRGKRLLLHVPVSAVL